MTLTVGRVLLATIAVLVGGVSALSAQQPESDPASVERIRAALQSAQQSSMNLVMPTKPGEFHWGVLTFVPPDTRGQFVAVRVPIGALASLAAHSITAAQHRHAEIAARAEVADVVAELRRLEAR